MPITYRPAGDPDLERSDRLVIAGINDLTRRHGFGPMAMSHPPAFQSFSRAKSIHRLAAGGSAAHRPLK
jgi:hypothetical protein